MGNISSGAKDNNELVDRLRLLRYIKTKKIERVFRAVDRGDYVLLSENDSENQVYKDLSWKVGNIHLSAPCIYAKVVEGLSLESGLSFLNIGSGTGYLSTIVGLILNSDGVNHGIEINKDCVDFANEKLEQFKKTSYAIDNFDFCEPIFLHGNFAKIVPNRQYDRIYCGAECPESHEMFIKQFVKIGGILVMPYKGHLLRIERIGENIWQQRIMLPVSFTPLVLPKNCTSDDREHMSIQFPLSQPLSLQEWCRSSIRSQIRKNIQMSYPELEHCYPIHKQLSMVYYENNNNNNKNNNSNMGKKSSLSSDKMCSDDNDTCNGLMPIKSPQLFLRSFKKLQDQLIVTHSKSPDTNIKFSNSDIDVDLREFKNYCRKYENSRFIPDLQSAQSTFNQYSPAAGKNSQKSYTMNTNENNILCSVQQQIHIFPMITTRADRYDIQCTVDKLQCGDHSLFATEQYDNNSRKINATNCGIPSGEYSIPQLQPELFDVNYCPLQATCDLNEEVCQSGHVYASNVNFKLMSCHMKQKIFQLPLPLSLRIFIVNNLIQ